MTKCSLTANTSVHVLCVLHTTLMSLSTQHKASGGPPTETIRRNDRRIQRAEASGNYHPGTERINGNLWLRPTSHA